jgi:hypothetical protein
VGSERATDKESQTDIRLARLESAIWTLVALLGCILAAMIVAIVWMALWEKGLAAETVAATVSTGGG